MEFSFRIIILLVIGVIALFILAVLILGYSGNVNTAVADVLERIFGITKEISGGNG